MQLNLYKLMQNEKICHQGHVLDEGKQICSRCNEPAESEIVDNKTIPLNQELPKQELSSVNAPSSDGQPPTDSEPSPESEPPPANANEGEKQPAENVPVEDGDKFSEEVEVNESADAAPALEVGASASPKKKNKKKK